jgi:hypothetical protein
MSATIPGTTDPAADPAATAPPADPQATPDAPPAEQAPEPKPTETVEFWKRKAREQEDRAKSNADAARKLKEIEDRDLTELQRAQRAAEEATATLADLQRQNTLLAKGIPADLIPPVNATPDDLAAFADRLIAWRGAPAPAAPPIPRPDGGQGPRPLDAKAAEDAAYDAYSQAFFTPHSR